MTHRHFGVRGMKPPATNTGPWSAAAWSGRALVTGIVVGLIVLAAVVYRLSTNTNASAPRIAGQGAAATAPVRR